jgi:epoxyqueuosine reductase
MDHAAAIRSAAMEIGFARCGFAPLEPLPRARVLRDWLAAGMAGEMVYMRRRFDGRLDPRRLFPWARSVVSVTYPYPAPPPGPADWRRELRGRVAAYARGRDYHLEVAEKLRRLAGRIAHLGAGIETHAYVDTGPVLEREWAARSGLGWIGKNTLLLDRGRGSWSFIGEVFTNLDLPPAALEADGCGACRRCLNACPTGALAEGFRLDARLCISYLTIEHRGAIPRELRPKLDNWVFGCDLCQEACPWNGAGHAADFDELYPSLPQLLDLDVPGFRARFGHTAVARAKRRGLARNAAVALGNSGNPEAMPPLIRALEDSEPLVRGHAAWALGRLGGPRARQALDAARRREAESSVRDEMEQALSGG